MPIVLANVNKAVLLDQERGYLNARKVRLYTNDPALTGAMVMSTFTFPADSGGKVVYAVYFAQAILNVANQGELDGQPLTWNFTHDFGDFTVYGYVVYDDVGNTPVYAERAPAPFTCTAAGQTYTVTLKKFMDTM